MTTTIIENATTEEARRAFLQICKTGVPISAADFDAATQWMMPASPEASADDEPPRQPDF